MNKLHIFGITNRFRMFTGIAALFIAVVLILFARALYVIEENNKKVETLDNLLKEQNDMSNFELLFLAEYEEDLGFFKSSRHKYIDSHKGASMNFDNTLDKLLKYYKNTNTEVRINHLKMINGEYLNLFEQLHHNLYIRGSSTSGIVGNVNKLFISIKKHINNKLLSDDIGKANNLYNEYLLQKNAQYYYKLDSLYDNLSDKFNQLNASIGEDGTVLENTELVQDFNNIRSGTTKLYEIDKKIGYSFSEGIKRALFDETLKFEPEITAIKKVILSEQQIYLSRNTRIVVIVAVILLIIIIVLGWFFVVNTSKEIRTLNKYFNPLSKGILPKDLLEIKRNTELNDMTKSINELIVGLKRTTQFVGQIGKGVFTTDYEPLSKEDSLGNTLLNMRTNLLEAQEDEKKRHEEDNIRKWTNEGLAEFNEILRENAGNIDNLTLSIVRNITNFLKANQSGLFLINDSNKEDIHLELIATYAYDKDRKKQKKIYLGEGLVGMCAVEKSTVYLEDIPQGYLSINSGLGGASPRSLLILPLKIEDQIFGVLEIASFNKFKKYEIEFVEKVTESISSTLSLAKINSRTAMLLEKSQRQAEEMATQEEEMRQNFEELNASQEASMRREAEMSSILQAINTSSLVIEFDLNGYIINANQAFLKLLNIDVVNLVGKHQSDFEGMDKANIRPESFWNRLKNGEIITDTLKIFSGENTRWLYEVYTPILDEDGNPYKILNMATDITENKKLEQELLEKTKRMKIQEEELKKNLSELKEIQEGMTERQSALEDANNKIKSNESKLNKAIAKAKENERLLKERNAELAEHEITYVKQIQEFELYAKRIKNENEEYKKHNAKLVSTEKALKIQLDDMKKRTKKFEEQLVVKKEEELKLLEELDTLIVEIEKLKGNQ